MRIAGLLAGRVVAISGAGRGNGRAIACGLAGCGATILATDVDADAARATAAAIVADGGRAFGDGLDVTDAGACAAWVRRRISEGIGPDGLVNNAGIIVRERLDSPTAAVDFARVLDVNLTGAFNLTMACLGPLKARRGAVVNVASIASFIGLVGSVGYSASKGGLRLLTQSMAAELAADGIRINAIAPGFIDTPMTAALTADDDRRRRLLARIPMGRVGQPEDLVGAVAFLLSPMAGYITGATLPVDGGMLAT